MSAVQRLSEEAVRQIAAGEVVERPASAVKELLENAIDAGSSRIALETEQGGKSLIRVSDDGCGMTEEDALLCLERHTTSKIRTFSDLDRLITYGFRGEALPSISAISRMLLQTRAEGSAWGTEILMEGSRLAHRKDCGRARGTTVEVRDLFFNVPARLKFMKTDSSEKGRILRTFEETAAARPEIAFTLASEERKRREFPARAHALDRITDLWGKEFGEDSLVPLSFIHPNLKITGWVSKPSGHKPTKNYQMFYVNRRPIVSRFLVHALYESYRDCLPVGRHPAAVLFFELDPSFVDFNVHPSKREVKFKSEGEIYQCLLREIRAKRAELSGVPGLFLSAPAALAKGPTPPQGLPSSFSYERPSVFTQVRPSKTESQTSAPFKEDTHVLCQFNALYVIAQRADDLLIVDQHAAAERVLYERLKDSLKEGGVPSQALLIPYLWNVSLSDAQALRGRILELKNLGYILQEFGETTFRVTEAPAGFPEKDLGDALDELLAALASEKEPEAFKEAQIIRTACRSAVKANERLDNSTLAKILRDLEACQNPHTCPHGRPTTLVLSRAELDKRFGRNY